MVNFPVPAVLQCAVGVILHIIPQFSEAGEWRPQ